MNTEINELPSKHAVFDNHPFPLLNTVCLWKVWLQLMQTHQELFKLIGSDTQYSDDSMRSVWATKGVCSLVSTWLISVHQALCCHSSSTDSIVAGCSEYRPAQLDCWPAEQMHPNQLPQNPKVFSKDELPHFTYLKAKHREVKQSVQGNEQGSAKNTRMMAFDCQSLTQHYFFLWQWAINLENTQTAF